MSNREQYQGQPAAGYKPLEEWGQVKPLSNEELEVWKHSPVARFESRVIATLADLERQLAEAKAILSDLPDHNDVDAAVFEANALRGQLAAAQGKLKAVR